MNTLVKLRAEKRKAEIGFVSQEAKLSRAREQAEAEARKQELHKWKENRITVGPQHIIAAEKAA